ncbi:MAG TPA: GDSL-type esterase/lipase family protein [Xanthobacteraceae bacterium]|jgi:acyl-CoA thioesterase-1
MPKQIFAFLIALTVALSISAGAASAQVVGLGASNTQGHGVGAAAAFPAQLQALLKAQGLSVSVANAGVFGDTTAGMLARLGSAVPNGTKVVIVQYGGNDSRKGISSAQTKANVAEIESRLRARGIKVVNADGQVSAALRAGLKQADNIHLTAEGHKQVAQAIVGSVAAALR